MMKWKIGVVLVLLIVFLPVIANAEETMPVYSIEEVIAYQNKGWEATVHVAFNNSQILQWLFVRGPKVGELLSLDGYATVYMEKDHESLYAYLSNFPFDVWVYKNGMDVDVRFLGTDDSGKISYPFEFTPKEPGYYKLVIKSGYYDWLPCNNEYPVYFYVSEKDFDGDGVPDQYDYDPYDPNVQTKSDIETP